MLETPLETEDTWKHSSSSCFHTSKGRDSLGLYILGSDQPRVSLGNCRGCFHNASVIRMKRTSGEIRRFQDLRNPSPLRSETRLQEAGEIDLEDVVGDDGTTCCFRDKLRVVADVGVAGGGCGESPVHGNSFGNCVDVAEDGDRSRRRRFVSNVDTQMEENSSFCCRRAPLFRLPSSCLEYRNNSFCFRFSNLKSFVGNDCH